MNEQQPLLTGNAQETRTSFMSKVSLDPVPMTSTPLPEQQKTIKTVTTFKKLSEEEESNLFNRL